MPGQQGIEWQIFTTIAALVTFVGVFVKYSYNISKTLTMLDATLKSLQKELEEMKNERKDFTKEVRERLDAHGDMLIKFENEMENRERRIRNLEKVIDIVVPEPSAISAECPRREKPVTSVAAWTSRFLAISLALLLSVLMLAMASAASVSPPL